MKFGLVCDGVFVTCSEIVWQLGDTDIKRLAGEEVLHKEHLPRMQREATVTILT